MALRRRSGTMQCPGTHSIGMASKNRFRSAYMCIGLWIALVSSFWRVIFDTSSSLYRSLHYRMVTVNNHKLRSFYM
jgi:hypothetical protein